jgi:hypothetical protein
LLFGLGVPEWVTILALAGSIPLTLKLMARASAAYERKAAERAQAASGETIQAESDRPEQGDGKDLT